MSKRLIVSVVAVCALFAAVVSMASEEGQLTILKPAAPGQKSDAIPITKQDLVKGRAMKILSDNRVLSKTMGVIDTLISPISETVNFGAAPGDTMACLFDPPAACYIKSVGILTQDWSGQFNDGFNLLIFKSNVDPTTFPPDSVDANGWMGYWDPDGNWVGSSWGVPPLGALMWGEFPCIAVDGQWIWTDMIWLGEEPDSEGEPFFIAYAPFGTAGQNFGTSGGDATDYIEWRGFKSYLTDGTSGNDGWHWRTYGWRFYVVVEFYENTPPTIGTMPHLPNTYSTGPYPPIEISISDIDANNPADAGVGAAHLVWSINGSAPDSTAMTGPAAGGTFTATLPNLTAVGDSIAYWVSASDPPGLYSKGVTFSFVVTSPKNPHADLLLVLEGTAGDLHNPSFYTDALDTLGYTYESWDWDANNGIDTSVTTFGWNTIVVGAWGNSGIPVRDYTGDEFAAFLDNGGNLFSSDMDYFYINVEPEEPTFAAGDFAYDYFAIASGSNDPGENIDSLVTGVAGDPISGNWAETPLALKWYAYTDNRGSNWFDYCLAVSGVGTDIFTAESGNGCGVRYDNGTFKTIYLSFMADALADTTETGEVVRQADFDSLLINVLRWFGTEKRTSVEPIDVSTVPTEYSLTQNYPNPFNPETIIEYAIPKAGDVKVSVYNLLGQRIAELVNEHQEAGKYHVTWNAKEMASGVYFYRLQAGDFTLTKKMLVLK